MAMLNVGAGKREIEIPEAYLAVENFRTIHDPIHARALVIEQEETAAIISLEITSMPEPEVEAIRRLVSGKTGIKESNIWVCVTHSFSSPHLLPDFILKTEENIALKGQYREAMQRAACEAAVEAMETRRAARLGVQSGTCDIVANRDVELPDGWWVGTNGDGPTDRTVTVLRFDDREGRTIAVLSHFAIQSSVMDQSELSGGGKPVTSDIAGNACAMVEKKYGEGMVALFLIGAAGDQAPVEKSVSETFEDGRKIRRDLHEQGFEICERLSRRLGEAICGIAEQAVCDRDICPVKTDRSTFKVPAKRMDKDLHSLTPTHSFAYVPDGEKETTVEALLLGDVALLGVRPELNCVTAARIMDNAGFPRTLVCTMVNGASKYMADEASYDRFCYEAMNSPWNRGAAELLTEESVRMLRGMR